MPSGIYKRIKGLKRKPLSEQHKRKLYESHKGKKQSQETIEKRRLKMLGHKTSDETRKKISEANKGRKVSEEIKKKMSESRKGRKHSEETKLKMSLVKKGKTPKNIDQIKGWSKGKKMSELARQRMSIAKKASPTRYWLGKKNPNSTSEKNYHWKGGITPLTKRIRGCFQYRQWRSDVFTKDNFTCQFCEIKGVYLEADHYPKMFSTIFHENKITSLEQAESCEEFWNINNGRTLCKPCHLKVKNL